MNKRQIFSIRYLSLVALLTLLFSSFSLAYSNTAITSGALEVLDSQTAAFLLSFDVDSVAAMTVLWDQIYPEVKITDKNEIAALAAAFKKIIIKEKTDYSLTDGYNKVYFATNAGIQYKISFEHHLLSSGGIQYELTNDSEFWLLFTSLSERYWTKSAG